MRKLFKNFQNLLKKLSWKKKEKAIQASIVKGKGIEEALLNLSDLIIPLLYLLVAYSMHALYFVISLFSFHSSKVEASQTQI